MPPKEGIVAIKHVNQVIWKKCTGEAHMPNVDYDHCFVCIPFWGSYPTCAVCGKKLIGKTRHFKGYISYFCGRCRKYRKQVGVPDRDSLT